MMLSEYFQIAPSPPPFCPASSDRQNSQGFYSRRALITGRQTPELTKFEEVPLLAAPAAASGF